MSTEQPKFCVDCRWCAAIIPFPMEAGPYCCHPKSRQDKGGEKFNLITGKETPEVDLHRMCGTMREFEHLCGPEGKLWEEKEGCGTCGTK